MSRLETSGEWVMKGLIDGYKTGERSFAKTTELTANYFLKGIITQEQFDKIRIECPAVTDEEAHE